MIDNGFTIYMTWIPPHVGIPSNERIDSLAKQAASNGRKSRFKVPHTDFYSNSLRSMEAKCQASLSDDFLIKGSLYFSLFYRTSSPT